MLNFGPEAGKSPGKSLPKKIIEEKVSKGEVLAAGVFRVGKPPGQRPLTG
jgi:hypothetical protein